MTIGFNAVSSLAAGKVDAATGFWNAEGVALRRQGVPIRIFKVDRYGAPPYPELVLVATRETIERRSRPGRSMVGGDRARLRVRDRATPSGLSTTCSPKSPASTAPNSRPSSTPCCRDLRPAPFDPAVLRAGRAGTSSTGCSNGRSTSTLAP